MADAMLNPSYRESTLPPLPLPAALPSVGSFAHMTPAPLPPPPPAPAPPPTAQQPSPSSKSDGGSAAEVGAQGGNNNSGHGDPQRQLQDRPPSPLPIRPAPASAPVAPCSGAGPLGPPPHGPAALMPSPPPPPLPPPPAATPPQVAEVSPHLHPQPGPGQGPQGPQQGQGQGQQGQQEQISPHIHPQPGPGQGHTGSGPGDDNVVIQGHHRHHHQQEHSPNLGRTHQQEHSPSLGPHHQPQPQQPQLQPPQSHPQQHHRGHGHHHHHQHHRDASSANATNKRGDDSQRGPNDGHSEKEAVAVVADEATKPIEKTVVINLPPEAAERARDALDRHAAREEEVARVVRDLNLAVSPTDRNRALQSALSTFDHANAAMHDGEIDAGADSALTKHLALLLLKERQSSHQGGGEGGGGVKNEEGSSEGSSPRLGPLDSGSSPSASSAQTEELCEEITNVTEALEMMYRCSAERVRESYGRVGSELLPMLMSLVERDLGKRRRALASCSASAAVAAAAAARAAASANEEVDEDELDEEEKKRKQRQQENPESHQEVESAEAESKQKEDGRPEKGPEDETDQDGGPPPEKKRKVSEDGSPVLASVAFASSTKDASASGASASVPSSAAATIPHDCAATRQSSLGHACDYVSPTRNRRLRKITKVFGHFARVGALTQPLAYHSGLLSTLKHVIELPAGAGIGAGGGLGGDGVGSGLAVPREARLNCLWILANLACNAENMVMMACQPGLLDLLVRTALSPAQTSEDDYGDIDRYMEAIRSRSIAVRALLNLSWAPENKLLLSEHSRLVGALTEALSYRASSWAGFGRGVSGILLQTRRLAAGALRNLAAAPIRNKIRLCRQPLLQPPHSHSGRGTTGSICGGGGSQSLLDELTDAARHDPDAQVRDKAVATLHNLACADTAGGFARRPALLEVLSDAAMAYHNAYNNGGGAGGARITGRYTADAGNLANRTLRVLERSITEDMVEEYRAVRPLLDGVANAAAGRVSV